jgi:hypothetical protein
MHTILFTCAGTIHPYYLGVAKVLQDNIDDADVRFMGVSTGNLAAALLAYGIPIDCFFERYCRVLYKLQANGAQLGAPPAKCMISIQTLLSDFIPIYMRDNLTCCSNRLHINRLRSKFLPVVINSFANRSELINILMSSCFYTTFDNASFRPIKRKYISDIMAISDRIWISMVNKFRNSTVVISPDKWRDINPDGYWENFDISSMKQFYELGILDAKMHLDELVR